MKSDYRYSAGLVYNNFPWPAASAQQRERVEEKARAVLAAREKFMDWGAHAARVPVPASRRNPSNALEKSGAQKSSGTPGVIGGTPMTAGETPALPKTAAIESKTRKGKTPGLPEGAP